MKKLLITLLFIGLPILVFSKSFVIKTAYETYFIDGVSETMVYTDDITNKKTNYKVLEFKIEENLGFKIKTMSDGEYYLFDVYSIDGIQYITKYHYTYSKESNIIFFETPKGKINFSEFYDYYLRNLDREIEFNNLSGDNADAFRNETIKYLNGIKSGNITKLNSDRSFAITNTFGFTDYRNWKPKIKKGSAWKGTSDEYIVDTDFVKNLAIGKLTDTLMSWGTAKDDASNKQWVRIIRTQIKSIYEE